MNNLYALYYLEKEVDRGTARELAEKYNSTDFNLRRCCTRNEKFKRLYQVKLIGETKKKTYQYFVYKENKLICKGNRNDLSIFFKITKVEVDNAVKYGNKINDYKIIRKLVDTDKIERLQVVNSVVKEKKDKRLLYLIRHLSEYGNTVLGHLPEYKVNEYIDKLKSNGINARYKKIKYPEDTGYWYIVEVVDE